MQERNQRKIQWQALLAIFDPEDGGIMFFRGVR
jgi:hypothetical protein